jgi:hypothetical protein
MQTQHQREQSQARRQIRFFPASTLCTHAPRSCICGATLDDAKCEALLDLTGAPMRRYLQSRSKYSSGALARGIEAQRETWGVAARRARSSYGPAVRGESTAAHSSPSPARRRVDHPQRAVRFGRVRTMVFDNRVDGSMEWSPVEVLCRTLATSSASRADGRSRAARGGGRRKNGWDTGMVRVAWHHLRVYSLWHHAWTAFAVEKV